MYSIPTIITGTLLLNSDQIFKKEHTPSMILKSIPNTSLLSIEKNIFI